MYGQQMNIDNAKFAAQSVKDNADMVCTLNHPIPYLIISAPLHPCTFPDIFGIPSGTLDVVLRNIMIINCV